MRISAVFTMIFAAVALILTGIFILAKWDTTPTINDLWAYITFWPATFINTFLKLFNDPASILKLGIFTYITLLVQFGAVLTAVIDAHATDRHVWDWGIATFVFPFAAPFFLVFLKEN